MVWLSIILLLTQAACWVTALTGPNVCSRKETYIVTMRIHERKPVTAKRYTWCFNMPPRCTKYKIEMMDQYRIQSEPRTRWVNECCVGFEPDDGNQTCIPVCMQGCLHGTCVAPDHCSCSPGYMGPLCDTQCTYGLWGWSCKEQCSCLHSAHCHHETGKCICPPGWTGHRCDVPCSRGSYGEDCRHACSCKGSSSCHHVTGICENMITSACIGSADCKSQDTSDGTQRPIVSNIPRVQIPPSNVTSDFPISEPLVTTSEDLHEHTEIHHVENDGSHITETPPSRLFLENADLQVTQLGNHTIKNIQKELSVPGVQVTYDPRLTENTDDITEPSFALHNTSITTTSLTETYPAATTGSRPILSERTTAQGVTKKRISYDDKSHEDQLDHAKLEQVTDENTSKDQFGMLDEDKLQEGENNARTTHEDSVLEEHNTQAHNPLDEVVTVGTVQEKTEEVRKKNTDQKKFKHKEHVKDTLIQKAVKKDYEWSTSEPVLVEPPLNQESPYRDNIGKNVDHGKSKRVSEEKSVHDVKGMSDIGLLKVAPNQERQSSGGKSGYSDFLSSFSIAAGVSTAIIMVAGLITLMARCRKAKPDTPTHQDQGNSGVEMAVMNASSSLSPEVSSKSASSAVMDETNISVVRPVFFSPLYLPGDVAPADTNGGLILTAVFSTPATNIHDIYRQQDKLRESLAAHYDIPPAVSRCRESTIQESPALGSTETEHVYEELPCWRHQCPTPSNGTSQC